MKKKKKKSNKKSLTTKPAIFPTTQEAKKKLVVRVGSAIWNNLGVIFNVVEHGVRIWQETHGHHNTPP